MHTNYYCFRQLAKALRIKLKNSILATTFSQNKNELVLGFLKDKQEIWIKILLLADTTLLAFPSNFNRAKKNSIDLFQMLSGLEFADTQTFDQERLLCLNFAADYQLVIQAFGKDNNVIVFQKGVPVHSFKKSKRRLALTKLVKPAPPATFEYFQKFGYEKTWPSLAGLKQPIQAKNSEQQWALIQKLLRYLEHPEYYITSQNHKINLSFFEPPKYLFKTADVLEACTYFFKQYLYHYQFQTEQNLQLKVLQRQLAKTNHYIQSKRAQLKNLEQSSKYRAIADILMANLNRLEAYSETITLFDFYTGQNITIKLNPKLAPAENAAQYYRKAKNQNIAKAKLHENIETKLKALENLKVQINQLEKVPDLKTLRRQTSKGSPKPTRRQPYREVIFQNFKIWIGKSAKDNDLLLNQHSHKNDMWLHAKDAKGSHVIIKGSASVYPPPVLEAAASWAATYSDRKHETLAPVSYTLRKYVRKRKGLGQVILEREQVIMVKPKVLK